MKHDPPPRTKKGVYKRTVRPILLDLFQSTSFETFRIVAFWLFVGAALLLSWEVVKRIYVTPSVADREPVTFAIQKDWQQRQERDPQLDRMKLEFSLAVLFMTTWWNLQPVRFIRLWLKPPYKPITVKLFRLFFATSLIGAISYFVGQVTRHQRTFADYRAAVEIATVWIAVLWVLVTAVLRFANRQDQP